MPFVSLNPSNNVANNVQSGHKNDVICSPSDGKTRGGLKAFHIGAAGPSNNDGKQIMGWSRDRIANACKDVTAARKLRSEGSMPLSSIMRGW